MYKTFPLLRTGFLVFLCALALDFSGAQASALFTVSDVQIDVSAENALQAREQAFAQAQVKAFEILAGRMLPESESAAFTAPEASVISTLIQDFEVTKEQLSATRYAGTYTFRFRNSAVKQYFSGAGVSFSDVESRPVLVLPFYQQEGKTVLWSPFNLWMKAWNRAEDLQTGLVPLVVPIGDLADASDIDDDEALEYDQTKLNALVARYSAGEAVLMIANPSPDLAAAESDASPATGSINILLYRTDRAGPEFVQDLVLEANADETVAAFLDRAVSDSRKALQRNWKAQTVAAPDNMRNLRVRVQFETLQQWAQTQAALRKVPGLSAFTIAALTPQQAELDLTFRGDEQRLRLALKQGDFTLSTPRISGGFLEAGHYRSGRYDRSAVAPLVYDLYLNKYAPADLQPVYSRKAGEDEDQESAPENSSDTSVPQNPGAIAPEAGGDDLQSYEQIRGTYRRQF